MEVSMPRHIIKLLKTRGKMRILKATREKDHIACTSQKMMTLYFFFCWKQCKQEENGAVFLSLKEETQLST